MTDKHNPMAKFFPGVDVVRLAKDKSYSDGFIVGYSAGVNNGAMAAIILAAAGLKTEKKEVKP